jgi:hypothetical protein
MWIAPTASSRNRTGDSAMKIINVNLIGGAAHGHGEKASGRWRFTERTPIDSQEAPYSPCNQRHYEPVSDPC